MNVKFPKKLTAAVLAAFMMTTSATPVLAQETVVAVQNEAGMENPPAKPGGANTMTYDYTGALSGYVNTNGTQEVKVNATLSTDTVDQNVVLVQNGGTLSVSKSTLDKSVADKNGDNCNFYGINAIAHSVGENSLLIVDASSLTADSTGSNAVFATNKAKAYVNNSTIVTQAANARGLDATYGGTIVANDMAISTAGDHSAAVATDRGGGNVSLTNSTLFTAGSGSPLAYSTGKIEYDNVTGTATGSQIAGMEGLNTISIRNSALTSTITSKTASDPVANGVIIYQSTSGDAETATGDEARFEVENSTLSSSIEEGSMFYVTNTTANVVLEDSVLDFDAQKAKLLTIAENNANSWGQEGKNGATVNFTGLGQALLGDISVDTTSSLHLFLLDGSDYTGAITIEEASANTVAAPATVSVDKSSMWTLTKDTKINVLHMETGAKIVDEDGEAVNIVCDGATVQKGESDLTLTVTDSCDTTVTTTEANALSEDNIDRSGFDDTMDTDTTFGTNRDKEQNTNITELERVDDQADEGGQPGGDGNGQPPALPNEGANFADVSKDHWAYEDISTAARFGLMKGTSDTTFSPNLALSRAMLVTMLYRLESEPEVSADASFSDVSSDAYYAKAVAWAKEEGIVNGVTTTTFAPNDDVSRQELATILYRYAQMKGYDTTLSDGDGLGAFVDQSDISAYAQEAFAWAVDKTIVSGIGDSTLAPADGATRAQAAAMLVRFLEAENALPQGPGGDNPPAKPGETANNIETVA